jgi:hypothetical protein
VKGFVGLSSISLLPVLDLMGDRIPFVRFSFNRPEFYVGKVGHETLHLGSEEMFLRKVFLK